MSESKHTLGPWAVDRDWREGGADQVLAADDSTICFMATGRDEEEAEANNRLIAAAPDLLAACKAGEQFIIVHLPSCKHGAGGCTCGLDEVREQLRAAIARQKERA